MSDPSNSKKRREAAQSVLRTTLAVAAAFLLLTHGAIAFGGVVVDSFESGNVTEWSSSSPGFPNWKASQNRTFEGSYAGEYDLGSDSASSVERCVNESEEKTGDGDECDTSPSVNQLSFWFNIKDLGGGQNPAMEFRGANQNTNVGYGEVNVNHSGELSIEDDNGFKYLRNINRNKWYQAHFNYNYTDYTFQFTLSDASGTVLNQTGWRPMAASKDTGKPKSIDILGRGGNQVFYIDLIERDGQTPVDGRMYGRVSEDGSPNAIENATVDVDQNGNDVTETTTDADGEYDVRLQNGTYNVTVSKSGYISNTRKITVQGETEANFELVNLSARLELEFNPYMKHGKSQEYTVKFHNATSGNVEDVTDNASVSSGNTSVVTVDLVNNRLVSTNNTSINRRTYIRAEYQAGGETYATDRNLTVANETIKNTKILPPVQKFTATLKDTQWQVIFLGATLGAAVSLIATSWAGIAAYQMVITAGWILGRVDHGIALVALFVSLFIGLNVATNVDYSVIRD